MDDLLIEYPIYNLSNEDIIDRENILNININIPRYVTDALQTNINFHLNQYLTNASMGQIHLNKRDIKKVIEIIFYYIEPIFNISYYYNENVNIEINQNVIRNIIHPILFPLLYVLLFPNNNIPFSDDEIFLMTMINNYENIGIEDLKYEYNNNIRILNNITLNNLQTNENPMNTDEKLYIFRNQYQLNLLRIQVINSNILNTQ